MSERYIKLFSSKENLYAKDSPVVIRAGALLKDSQTGKMIAQLKFQSVSEKTISYLKIAISQLDAVNNPLGEPVAFEYLDLSVGYRKEFGSKKPLPLPNASARGFVVGVSTVGFADGSVWTCDDPDWQPMVNDSAVARLMQVESRYEEALALFQSDRVDDVKKALEYFTEIRDEKDVTVEIAQCENKIQELQEQERLAIETIQQNTVKRKKILKWSAIAAGVAVLLVLVSYFVIYPFISVKNGNYKVYVNMYHVTDYEIPDGVTSIDMYAFSGCDSLESITIPDSVTSIGYYAFWGCTNLSSITIPNSVTSIGGYAFHYCTSLTSITIPDSVTSIGGGAFEGCNSLTSIVIPDSVTSIGGWAFEGCNSLESITLPFIGKTENGTSGIDFRYIFGPNCDVPASLKTVVITGGTSIDDYAFSDCDSLESIRIPDSVTSIGKNAFSGCGSLASITIPKSVTSIDESAFKGCDSLESIRIPDSVTSIGKNAFWLR